MTRKLASAEDLIRTTGTEPQAAAALMILLRTSMSRIGCWELGKIKMQTMMNAMSAADVE
jgi:hypothetical protein